MTKQLDTSKPNCAFDAWIEQYVFEREVVGEAECSRRDGPWDVDCAVADDTDEGNIRPVYVAHCGCDLERSPGDDEWDIKLHGHYLSCLEAVAEYTSDIAAAWNMEERIARRNLWREYAGRLMSIVGYSELQDDGIRVTKADPWNIAHSTPLQRCQAAYAALTK